MAENDLPKTGVRAVVENFDGFIRDNERLGQVAERTGKRLEQSAKRGSKFDTVLGNLSTKIKNLTENVIRSIPGGQQLLGVVGDLIPSFEGMSVAALASVAAIAALVAGFVSLAVRGANITGLAQGFDIQVRRVGIASGQLLRELDQAARGTVSRLELIRNTNIALAGAVGQFGQAFGQKLPKILEIARIQARNTGQSVEFLFNSLVSGIKRSSPLLIDNTGLVLKVGEANQKYADEIGKTVSQLTAEEKQIALLNATLDAGQRAIEAFGNLQETAADKIARGQATISNILDTLALSVQPLFEPLLDGLNGVLGLVQTLAEALAPIISQIARFGGIVVGQLFNQIVEGIRPIIDFIAGVAPYIALAFRTVNDIIVGVRDLIVGAVTQIVEFIRSAVGIDLGFNFAELPRQFFEGAAAVIGSLANGIIFAANNLVFPAIISIATFIHDFLMGLSPPKRGPLSTIDKGGANLMAAWLQGITGVSLEPINQVARSVQQSLGAIASLTRDQVEKRFSELDMALLPFQNRLDIIQSQFEAIAEPAEAALRAIDRQTEKLTNKVLLGDRAAAQQLKVLESQRAAIQGQVDQQQALVDTAQIQLALAKAQQAQERALLTIRQKQLGPASKKKKKTETKAGALPKGATGEAADITPPAGAGIEPFTGTGDTALGLLTGTDAINEAQQGLISAFEGQIDTSQLDQLVGRNQELQGIFGEISKIDVGGKLKNRIGGLVDSVVGFFTGLPTRISEALQNFGDTINNSIVIPVRDFLTGTGEGTLRSYIDLAVGFITGIPTRITEGLETFGDTIDAQILAPIRNFLTHAGEGTLQFYIAQAVGFFTGLPNRIVEAVASLGTTIQENIIQPIANFLTGDASTEGTLRYIIDQAVNFFRSFPSQVLVAIQGFGLTVYNALVPPLVNTINAIIGVVEQGVRNVASFMFNIINDFTSNLAQNNLGQLIPQGLLDLQASLGNARFANLGRITPTVPEFLTAPVVNQGGHTTTNNTNITFNGVQGAEDSAQRFATVRARS